jgi:hypothetical protein
LEDADYWLERPTELERALRLAKIREHGPHPGPIGIGGGRAHVVNDALERLSWPENVIVVLQPGYFADHLDELQAGLSEIAQEREDSSIDLDALRERQTFEPEPERDDRDRGIER